MIQKDIKSKINHIQDLPTLPDVVLHCNQLLNDENVLVDDLAKIIEEDQSITAKILRVVNSAFYGFPRKISSISQAVIILGFNIISNIMLSVSVFSSFSESKGSDLFDLAKFWKHSIGCGSTAKFIGEELNIAHSGETFVAGLLHDLGKIILIQYFHNEFCQALEIAHNKNILIVEAEKEGLGISHSQIGRFLAEKWKLPQNLVDAITFHHDPSHSKIAPELSSIIHLSDIICRGINIGNSGDNSIPEIDHYVWDKFGLESDMIGKWLPDIKNQADLASMLFLNNE